MSDKQAAKVEIVNWTYEYASKNPDPLAVRGWRFRWVELGWEVEVLTEATGRWAESRDRAWETPLTLEHNAKVFPAIYPGFHIIRKPATETVTAHNADCTVDDATYWATVADGASHHPQCVRNLVTRPKYIEGLEWVCLRCQLEDANYKLRKLSTLPEFPRIDTKSVKAWAVMSPDEPDSVLFIETSRKAAASWPEETVVIPGRFIYTPKGGDRGEGK